MTKEEILSILAECGIEENKVAARALLNAFNEEKRNVIAEISNKTINDMKDWKSPEEHQKELSKMEAENLKLKEQLGVFEAKEKENTLKDSLKSKGIKEKYLKIAMSEGLDPSSEDFEEKFKSFSESYPEFVETTNGENQQAVQPNVVNVGNVGTQPVPQVSKEDALRDSLSSEFPWLKQ